VKPCSAHGCNNPVVARGLCGMHYMRLCRSGDFIPTKPIDGCSVPGCDNRHYARGYCKKHYYRMYRNGTLTKRQTGPQNPQGTRGCRKSLIDRNRKIITMRDNGKTYGDIAKVFNITRQAVQQVYKVYKGKI
jgi:hypothetical protein